MATGTKESGLRQFKRLRKIPDVIKAVRERGYPLDTASFDRGGDWISFGTPIFGAGGKTDFGTTFLNAVSGRFVTKNSRGIPVATESSGLDGARWFDELLGMIYEPLPPEGGQAVRKEACPCAHQAER